MAKKPKAPNYQQHSYAYWTNKFASPTDFLISKATATDPTSSKVSYGASDKLMGVLSAADKAAGEYRTVSDAIGGDPNARSSVKGMDLSKVSAQNRALFQQVQALEAQAGHADDEGFVTRVFDVLSRPMYAIANAFNATIREEQRANGSTDINDAAYIPIIGSQWWNAFTHGGDMWDGLAGYEKMDWTQVLDRAHPDMNNVAKGVLGFGLNVAMDPTSYIGVGVVKNVATKATGDLAKLDKAANETSKVLADAFKGSPDAAYKVRDLMEKDFVAQGIKDDPLLKMDFSNPENIKNLLTLETTKGSKKNVKHVALSPGELKARQQQVVTTFLSATKSVLGKSLEVQRWQELRAEALASGAMHDLSKFQPKSVITTLKYEALTEPEAQVIAKVAHLRKKSAYLSHKIAKAGTNKETHLIPEYKAQQAQISKEISKYVDETVIDMKNPDIIQAINNTYMYDQEFIHANNVYKAARAKVERWEAAAEGDLAHITATSPINKEAVKGSKLPKSERRDSGAYRGAFKNRMMDDAISPDGMGALNVEQAVGRTRAQHASAKSKTQARWSGYQKALKERDAAEAARAQIMSDRILRVMDDINMPETARLATYRKLKDWRHVADKFIKVYLRERAAVNTADSAAEAAAMAGDLGKAVQANTAKMDLGKASKLLNKTLENVKRELQYRIYHGELTPAEAGAYLRERGIYDPGLFHDFTMLEAKDSRILHFGESLKPEIAAQKVIDDTGLDAAVKHNAMIDDALHAQAITDAAAIADRTYATAIDLMVQSTSAATRKEMTLRLGFMGNGPVVAALGTPELVQKLIEAAYKVPVVQNSVRSFNKALVSSAGMEKGLQRIRAREAGRTTEVIARNGERLKATVGVINPQDRKLIFNEMLRSDVKIYTQPAVQKALYDEFALLAQKFQVNAFPGLREPLSLAEVNAWIPGAHRMKEGKIKGWVLDGKTMQDSEDPVQWLLNTLRSSNIKEMDPFQVLWDLQIASEKALARKATIETVVQQFGIASGRHSIIDDPMVRILADKYGYRPHNKFGGDDFVFNPEIAKQLDKIDELFSSPKHLDILGEYAGQITQAWKRAVTIYNPGFHSRNTFGDIFVSWLDGVQGAHGVQSHRMAIRTIKKFRNLTDPNDPLIKAMGQPNMAGAYDAIPKALRPESHNVVLFRKNGKEYTMGDIYSLYVNEGLLSGFTNTDFAAVVKTPGSVGASKMGQKATGINQGVMHLSEAREDIFRLAHFIDVIRKSPMKDSVAAAAEAGARVRKYHFDYSDFTMTEKVLLARVFPFYKWTRKALPLMVESLFAMPGKLQLVPKASQSLGVAAGFGGNSPDLVTPEWIGDRFLAPVGQREGVTTYAGVALPYDALRALGNPIESMGQMLHPGLKLLGDAVYQQKQNGAPTGDLGQTVAGLFPQTNLAYKQSTGQGTPEQLASFATGLTLTQNNDKTMYAELRRRLEAAKSAQPKP